MLRLIPLFGAGWGGMRKRAEEMCKTFWLFKGHKVCLKYSILAQFLKVRISFFIYFFSFSILFKAEEKCSGNKIENWAKE